MPLEKGIDDGSFDTPPKTAPRKPATGTAKVAGAVPWAEIESSLVATYVMAGTAIVMTPGVPQRVHPVGQAIVMNAEKCTDAWIEAAKKNPKLAKALTRFVSGGAYMGLVAAHMPIVFALTMAVQGVELPPPPQPKDVDSPEEATVHPLFTINDMP